MNASGHSVSQVDADNNATYLFERKGELLPASSESFWTACFGFFMLHLASARRQLRIWECREAVCAPWYWKRASSPFLDLSGLTFSDISMEPTTALGRVANVDVRIAGFRPDLLLRFSGEEPTILLIENKTTDCAQPNQLENYPALSRTLDENHVRNQVLWLVSVGSSSHLYEQLKSLESSLKDPIRNPPLGGRSASDG